MIQQPTIKDAEDTEDPTRESESERREDETMAAVVEGNERDINTTGKKKNLDSHFTQSRKDVLTDLLKEGTFQITSKAKISAGERIFGPRFLDEVKKAGEGLRRKSRLVAKITRTSRQEG